MHNNDNNVSREDYNTLLLISIMGWIGFFFALGVLIGSAT
jgi:hypothetical protein